MDAAYFEREFGVTMPAIERVLAEAMSSDADVADLFFQHATSLQVSSVRGRLAETGFDVSAGVGVRTCSPDRTGYAFAESLALTDMLEAARIARWQPSAPAVRADIRCAPSLECVRGFAEGDSNPDALPRVVSLLDYVDAQARAAEGVSDVRLALALGESRVLVVDSGGQLSIDYRPMTRLWLRLQVTIHGRRVPGQSKCAGRGSLSYYTPDRLKTLIETAVDRARAAASAQPAPSGTMPVVFARGAAGLFLHEAVGHGLEADYCLRGVSAYAGRIGQQVAPADVTVIDDCAPSELRGSLAIDDEGTATAATTLIENGRLRGYLHDRTTARRMAQTATGNGRRQSFRHPPQPRMRATLMQAGACGADEIIRSVERGLYCAYISDGRVNTGEGTFSFRLGHGALIERGKLTRPVSEALLVGNGPQALERIAMVGDDLAIDESGWNCVKASQIVPISVGMPTLRVDDLVVRGGAS